MMKKLMYIAGAGSGLGLGAAKVFGRRGYAVVLMARGEARLRREAEALRAEGIEAHVHPADAADFPAMKERWDEAVRLYGEPDLLFYNVGITAADADAGPITAETLMARYAADTAGAYHCVRLAATDSFGRRGGAILITGGGLALAPSAAYLPLSMDKAALRAMVLALAPALKEKGIYLGTVQVTGVIGGSGRFAPEAIAEKFLELCEARDAAEIVY